MRVYCYLEVALSIKHSIGMDLGSWILQALVLSTCLVRLHFLRCPYDPLSACQQLYVLCRMRARNDRSLDELSFWDPLIPLHRAHTKAWRPGGSTNYFPKADAVASVVGTMT